MENTPFSFCRSKFSLAMMSRKKSHKERRAWRIV